MNERAQIQNLVKSQKTKQIHEQDENIESVSRSSQGSNAKNRIGKSNPFIKAKNKANNLGMKMAERSKSKTDSAQIDDSSSLKAAQTKQMNSNPP